MNEFLRPWKLFSLLCGICLLVLGSFYYKAPDWDITISLIMAACTYLTASWSLHVLLDRRWKLLPVALFYTWFSVDGCYAIYWHFTDPQALELMRDANFPASLSLYGICALIWFPKSDLKGILQYLKQ